MKSILSQNRILEVTVPASWEPVLKQLDDFIGAETRARLNRGEAELKEVVQCHDLLVKASGELLDKHAFDDVEPQEFAHQFAFALLATAEIEKSTVGDHLLDGAGSKTLSGMSADFRGQPGDLQTVRTKIIDCLNLDEDQLHAIEARLYHAQADMRCKHRVLKGLREVFNLVEGPHLDESVCELFRFLFPTLPLRAGHITTVVAGTQIFFTLPFKGSKWNLSYFDELTPSQQQTLQKFIDEIFDFNQTYLAHFPVFTDLDTTALNRDVLASIATAAGCPQGVIIEELPRMVIIVPLEEIEKYLVHDIWGHTWQAAILFFDDIYRKVSCYGQPLDLLPTNPEDHPALLECFETENHFAFNERAFHQLILKTMEERIPMAFTPAIAELIADVMEHKFIATNPSIADELDSSSLFVGLPTKLDLMLQDLSLYYRHATKIFTSWADDPQHRAEQVAQLQALGASASAASSGMDRALAIWQSYASGFLAPKIKWQKQPNGEIRINAMTRLALNILGIHRETSGVLQELGQKKFIELPLNGVYDVLALATSSFFEANRARNFWHIDEFLALKFRGLCDLFGLE